MTVTPNTGPKLIVRAYQEWASHECLGEYCPKQPASAGETEGADAIRQTVEPCNEATRCILDNTLAGEAQNA